MASASSLLLDERFTAGDSRFLEEVLTSTSAKRLKAFAPRFYQDGRPCAREALLKYIDDGASRPHHRPLVKALYKLSEKAGDDEVVGRFLVAFDRYIQRKITTVRAWDHRIQKHVNVVNIVRDKTLLSKQRSTEDPHFSLRTRRYLQKRAFRYFRRLAQKDPARYGRAVRALLIHYRDEHLDSPAKLMDAWGLMHILYGKSKVLSRVPRGIVLSPGFGLSELTPAPMYPAAWKDCLGDLVTLLKKAESRTVRAFALDLMKQEYAESLRTIPVLRIRALLLSPHEEAQTFGAELLSKSSQIHLLPIADWLELLTVKAPMALSLICDLVAKHVSPSRLSLDDCVALGCGRVGPVAELGLTWAQKKKINTEAEVIALLGFAKAESANVRNQAMEWVVGEISKSIAVGPTHVRDLLDSKHSDVRGHAMTLFMKEGRFRDSMVCWSALAESPYEDVRSFLIRHVESRKALLKEGSMKHIWASALLAISLTKKGSGPGAHSTGKNRDKRRVLNQVASVIATSPERAEELLPLLGILLRSVRPAEQRAAIAAIGRAASQSPRLMNVMANMLPELRIVHAEAAL